MPLPRWIDDPACDSSAMLAAYLGYHSRQGGADQKVCEFQDLYMIVHQPDDVLAPSLCLANGSIPLPTRLCQAPQCMRCQREMGGYQFRWYHPAWEEYYLQHKRLGAWSPR